MNVKKMAQQDAYRWAEAEMFFGEGAGTARKLLSAELNEKMLKVPGYQSAFDKSYAVQDFASHALRAAKRRKSINRNKYVRKNVSALLRADRKNLSNGVAAVVIVAGVARATGYDKVAVAKVKHEKDRFDEWRRKRHLRVVQGDVVPGKP